MSDQPLDDDMEDSILFGSELSDREVYAIGKIVSLWGALEHEIFWQTYKAINPTSLNDLPKGMGNHRSSEVLKLWKQHVVDKAEGRRQAVLQKIYEQIEEVTPHRNAIVHGMWDWSVSEPEKIEVSRVKKDAIIAITFTAADLGQFSRLLAKMNFRIRYPGGLEEYAEAMTGVYMSRQFIAMTTNSPSAKDWFALRDVSKGIQLSPKDNAKTSS